MNGTVSIWYMTISFATAWLFNLRERLGTTLFNAILKFAFHFQISQDHTPCCVPEFKKRWNTYGNQVINTYINLLKVINVVVKCCDTCIKDWNIRKSQEIFRLNRKWFFRRMKLIFSNLKKVEVLIFIRICFNCLISLSVFVFSSTVCGFFHG